MVIDTSALIAILQQEPDADDLLRRLVGANARRLSAATLLETAIVLEARSGEKAGEQLDLFLARAGITIEPVTSEQAHLARKAWRRYGKGWGGSAGLNFGDCVSYALAKCCAEELLYKGGDFARTDLDR